MKSNKVINLTVEEGEFIHYVLASQSDTFGRGSDELRLYQDIREKLQAVLNPEGNILTRATDIVYNRGEEKDRNYGPFIESLERTAAAFNLITDNPGYLSAADVAMVMTQMKLTREGVTHREDNILDAVAYLAIYNDIKEAE